VAEESVFLIEDQFLLLKYMVKDQESIGYNLKKCEYHSKGLMMN